MAARYVHGIPSVVVSVLADFAGANLRKTLTADHIAQHLRREGFRLRDLAHDDRLYTVATELRGTVRDTFNGALVGGRLIPRPHATEILRKLSDNASAPIVVVHGPAGFGKSGTLLELTSLLGDNGIPYLPFRLDSQPPSGTPRAFGDTWGLPESPVLCLNQLAGDKFGVLILDQIDAMRWTSGHASDPWLTCQAMMRQAIRLGNVRVVVACRTFDLENDPQFIAWVRANEVEMVEVTDLDDSVIRSLLGDAHEALTAQQRKLLKSVQNLGIWLSLSLSLGSPIAFISATDLMRQFWDSNYDELNRRGVLAEDVEKVLRTLVDHFTHHGTLAAPVA